MAALADGIRVSGRFARSANLERDLGRAEPLDGYIVTARSLDVVERIAAAAASGEAGGAWSITGPYGSGKSSLALLIDAAFGGASPRRRTALELIDGASEHAGELVRRAHQRHRTEEAGFHLGPATAGREPLSRTVLRSLHKAVLRSYGKIPPPSRFAEAAALRRAIADDSAADPRRRGPSPAALVDIARCLAEDAPLLLMIDEFGKNLEAFRDGAAADPYLLQQLAEAGQSSAGLPIFILTLQHLSFEDYLGDSNEAQRREWAKVQGRFEDIPYVESPAQTRALIGSVFEAVDPGLRKRIRRWAREHADSMRLLGAPDLADPKTIESCYPLHPMAALVLPELCSRYGQNERTLFSFLAGPDPAGAASFLASREAPAADEPLPSVGLSAVYDYFVSNADPGALQSSRWAEISVRIRDAHGLTEPQERLAKAVALLNLISTSGAVRASRPVLELLDGAAAGALSELEAAGIITYREFADEYRIWAGTDVDVRRLLDAARRRVRRRPLAGLLSEIHEPAPVVAARHSAEHQVLRVFKRRYAAAGEAVEPPGPFSPYDGELLLMVDPEGGAPEAARTPSRFAKPVAAALPNDLAELEAAAREAAAVGLALEDPAAADDWVARRELGERMAQTRAALDRALASAFDADACRWVLTEDGASLAGGRGSAPLSDAADRAYPRTPAVRNEMINRTALTTQGSKARRTLLEAMIERGGETDLGITGYGPEMAMYQALLKRTGIHGFDGRNEEMVFRSPADDESLQPAWELLESEFKRAKNRRINLRHIYAALLSPPIGMKQGAAPVFITAGLIAFSGEVAIYEHGTFKPLLTPELSERMVRNPAHFDVKHFANTAGARRLVIDALAARLDVRPGFRKHRVANVLAVVGALVARINGLNNYTRRTAGLEPSALAARDALLAAVEPDGLLFEALPQALGFPSVPVDDDGCPWARRYAEAVGGALDDLASAYGRLLDRLLGLLLSSAAETSRLAVAGQAAALAGEVLDPDVRAFVLALANDGFEADRDWIEAAAAVVAQKAPAEWTDRDLQRFEQELPQRVAAFRRLTALHSGRRAGGGGAFASFRVIFTRPDGGEDARLVGFDRSLRPRLEAVLASAVEELADHTGSPQQAHESLLALMGEKLLPAQSVQPAQSSEDAPSSAGLDQAEVA